MSVENVNSVFCSIDFLSSIDSSGNAKYVSLTSNLEEGLGGNRPDYFISLRAERSSSRATTFSIQIQFAPMASTTIKDPSFIDRLIDVSGGECYITYGWGSGDLTNTFKCLITDYTISMNNGTLTYTINGTGFAVIFNYNSITISVDKDNPKEAIDLLMSKEYLGSKYKLDVTGTGLDDGTVTTTFFGTGLYGNPMELLIDIVRGLKPKSTKSTTSNSESENPRYLISVDDSIDTKDDGRGTIKIRKIDSSSIKAESDVITFTWSDPTGEVISWDPQYNGGTAIFVSQNMSNSSNTSEEESSLDLSQFSATYSIDPSNNSVMVVKAASTKLQPSSDGSFFSTSTLSYCNQIENYNKWYNENLGTYSYTSTLKVLGQPKLRSIGDIICVVALLGSGPHFSSGYYMITNVVDDLGSNGYTTTYELIKMKSFSNVLTWDSYLSTLSQSDVVIYQNGQSFLGVDAYQSYLLGSESNLEENEISEEYLIKVINGTSNSRSSIPGKTIIIQAKTDQGTFDYWKVNKGSINFDNDKNYSTSFIMPDSDVEIEAVYKEE